MTSKKRKQMPATSSEAIIQRAPIAPALAHYREIGPAAIVAALICVSKKKTGKAIKPS
jgi:hypothetical protein